MVMLLIQQEPSFYECWVEIKHKHNLHFVLRDLFCVFCPGSSVSVRFDSVIFFGQVALHDDDVSFFFFDQLLSRNWLGKWLRNIMQYFSVPLYANYCPSTQIEALWNLILSWTLNSLLILTFPEFYHYYQLILFNFTSCSHNIQVFITENI